MKKQTGRARDALDRGFTLIELLVVVLIIGVLAAIAVPVLLGQQNAAKDAALASDLASAKLAMAAYATDHNGTYLGVSAAAATTTALRNYGYAPSPGHTANVQVRTGGSSFCLQGTSATGTVFRITPTTATVAGNC